MQDRKSIIKSVGELGQMTVELFKVAYDVEDEQDLPEDVKARIKKIRDRQLQIQANEILLDKMDRDHGSYH